MSRLTSFSGKAEARTLPDCTAVVDIILLSTGGVFKARNEVPDSLSLCFFQLGGFLVFFKKGFVCVCVRVSFLFKSRFCY